MDETNPKDLVGATKPPLHLVPPVANIQESLVLALGVVKYKGPANWRQYPVQASIYVSAALRHLAQWFDGQDLDAESGMSHLAHARACMGILLDAEASSKMIDDRPISGKAAELIDIYTKSKPQEVDLDEVNLELLTADPEDTYDLDEWPCKDSEPDLMCPAPVGATELLNERTGLPPRKPPETAQDWLQFN